MIMTKSRIMPPSTSFPIQSFHTHPTPTSYNTHSRSIAQPELAPYHFKQIELFTTVNGPRGGSTWPHSHLGIYARAPHVPSYLIHLLKLCPTTITLITEDRLGRRVLLAAIRTAVRRIRERMHRPVLGVSTQILIHQCVSLFRHYPLPAMTNLKVIIRIYSRQLGCCLAR
ncbi:hypothetical protein BGY98DRAFT_434396 [Russula aff. rugulosa BPL654]|nr:hypothetical protein BGY98DRAFT_434396 [Russula aff. rugulosa BPL654]